MTAIIPNTTVTAPPGAPTGIAAMTAPSFGSSASAIARSPAMTYASVE